MVARVVLRAVDRVARVSPTREVVVEPSEKSQELRFIVERSDHLMAAFVAVRILSIVTYNPAMDGVVVGIYGGHIVSVRRRSAKCERHRPPQRVTCTLDGQFASPTRSGAFGDLIAFLASENVQAARRLAAAE